MIFPLDNSRSLEGSGGVAARCPQPGQLVAAANRATVNKRRILRIAMTFVWDRSLRSRRLAGSDRLVSRNP
jgi:hypothetical protein